MNSVFVGIIAVIAMALGAVHTEATERRHPAGLSFGIIVGGPAAHKPAQRQAKQQRANVASKACSAEQASRVARSYGIQFQTILSHRKTFTVTGFRDGHKVKIRLSRAPDCRVVR